MKNEESPAKDSDGQWNPNGDLQQQQLRKDEFALVCYLPGSLGVYLDQLRMDLVPDCHARSHVTLLPPRPLRGMAAEAAQQLRVGLPQFTPFRVELGEVAVFESTRVIYLELIQGREALADIHQALNRNSLHYKEPFQYHPHVTLAQGPVVEREVEQKLAVARDRWASFASPRSFMLDTVMFVQNGGCEGWIDLDQFPVGTEALETTRR